MKIVWKREKKGKLRFQDLPINTSFVFADVEYNPVVYRKVNVVSPSIHAALSETDGNVYNVNNHDLERELLVLEIELLCDLKGEESNED